MKAVLERHQERRLRRALHRRPGRRRPGVQEAPRAKGEQHPIESTGRELRKLMSWVKSHDTDYVEGTSAR